MSTARQGTLKDVLPKPTQLQRVAETYIIAENESSIHKERAKKRKDEMIALARKLGEDFVKVRDDAGFLHTFSFESKAQVRHTAMLDVKYDRDEKEEKEPVGSGTH